MPGHHGERLDVEREVLGRPFDPQPRVPLAGKPVVRRVHLDHVELRGVVLQALLGGLGIGRIPPGLQQGLVRPGRRADADPAHRSLHPGGSSLAGPATDPAELLAKGLHDALLVDVHPRIIDPRDLLQRPLEVVTGPLGLAKGMDQQGGVVGIERPAAPGAVAPAGLDLLGEELPPAVRARPLDPHAVSLVPVSSSTLSDSANASTGRSSQASAPDHLASQASWGRARTMMMAPGKGRSAPRRSLATAKAPAPEATPAPPPRWGAPPQAHPTPLTPPGAPKNPPPGGPPPRPGPGAP